MTKDKLINIGMWTGAIMAFLSLALMVGPALRFFFRGLLALTNHPLEAFCFFGLLTILWSAAVWVSEE